MTSSSLGSLMLASETEGVSGSAMTCCSTLVLFRQVRPVLQPQNRRGERQQSRALHQPEGPGSWQRGDGSTKLVHLRRVPVPGGGGGRDRPGQDAGQRRTIQALC